VRSRGVIVRCLWIQGQSQFLQKKECCAGALEGRLIATLCRLTRAKTVLEVGMFTGTTTLAIAEAIPEDGKVSFALLWLQSCLLVVTSIQLFYQQEPHFWKVFDVL